jgi:hypothetical protein
VRKGDRTPPSAAGPWPDWPTLGEVIELLHQATGMEFLADSFVRERVKPQWVTERQPVVRLLDRLAQELDCTWRKEGSLLILRSRAAHWDRALEVPERLVRPWQQRIAERGALSLDALSELAAALNDDQALVLQRRLVVLRLLVPHDRGSDVRPAPVMSCGASKRDRQTRRCNTRDGPLLGLVSGGRAIRFQRWL